MVISLEFDQQTFSQHCIMLISFDNNRDNRFVFIFLVSKVSQFCFCLSKLALSSRIIKRLFSGCVTRWEHDRCSSALVGHWVVWSPDSFYPGLSAYRPIWLCYALMWWGVLCALVILEAIPLGISISHWFNHAGQVSGERPNEFQHLAFQVQGWAMG